ncbi:MAG: tRNA (adenosine(37)-N6)-dimethylallyltransferase MiaA, partial [Candidatus Margulisbacteria bacterium]|nr:tRNA (adenosine(37)-N6)-dimethylallyltransferase MiaA [Candidatus Margulisiibacteriota bacterium]
DDGLIEEVASLLETYPSDLPAFQALGYKETIRYLKGSIAKEEMIELIKTKTRQFSKRQMTWYRRFKHVEWTSIS